MLMISFAACGEVSERRPWATRCLKLQWAGSLIHLMPLTDSSGSPFSRSISCRMSGFVRSVRTGTKGTTTLNSLFLIHAFPSSFLRKDSFLDGSLIQLTASALGSSSTSPPFLSLVRALILREGVELSSRGVSACWRNLITSFLGVSSLMLG